MRMNQELIDFPIKVQIPIAWGDMDAFNHVNNTKYFKYFETARIKYFEDIGLIELMKKKQIGPILASTSAKFIKAIQYPDIITVGTKITSLENSRFTMEFKIVSERLGLAAIGEARLVTYDYANFRKVEIPPSIKDSIQEIEGKSFS